MWEKRPPQHLTLRFRDASVGYKTQVVRKTLNAIAEDNNDVE